jgi:serine/threonine protein phosphatase PrpC
VLSRQLRLDVAQLTDVGRKRPHNEDNMAYVIPKDEQAMTRKGALFIVADGMGGHAAGEVASEIAVDTVTKAYYEDENEDIPLSLINAIKRANTIIHERASENTMRSGMGTTCVAAVLCGNVAFIANVGDSRAYIVHQTQVRQISQDHSWVEEQVRAGLLTHDQARSHAQRNVITRCLGTQIDVEVDVFPVPLSEGDTLVLCTDGLSGSIGEEDLTSIINQFVPQESVYHLVERANENGGPDNITAIVVRVLEVGANTPSVRYPVPAGSHKADVDTAVMTQVPAPSVGGSSRVEDKSKWNPSLEAATGPMPVLGGSSPLPSTSVSLAPSTRVRLLYPAFALIALIIASLFGGSIYAFRSMNNSANQLTTAHTLIDRANAESAQKPTDALQQLSLAQKALVSTQGPLLVGSQASQYNSLKTSLRDALQKAMTSYDQKEMVTQLSCRNTQSFAINGNVQPVSLRTMQDNGTPYSYVLANDHNLYQLDNQHQLKRFSVLPSNVTLLDLVGNGQHLFALTSLPGSSYRLSTLSFDQAPKLKEENPIPVDGSLLKDGSTPAFLTAYANDISLILTGGKLAHQATIVSYDAANWQNPPHAVQVSLSADLVSAAAFPNKQMFLLTSDGHVKSLMYGDGGNATHPDDLSLQNPVSPPLVNDTTNFSVDTPIVTAAPQSSQVVTSAQSGMTLLTASSVGDNPHLYVVDNPNHRVLDLKFVPSQSVNVTPVPTSNPSASTPTASSTPPAGVGGVNPASLKLLQQFASTSILSAVKSAAVSSDGKQLSLLTQGGGMLTTVSSTDKAPSC